MSTITADAIRSMAGMLSHVIPENDDPDDYDIIRGSIDMLRTLAAERAQQTGVPDGWKLMPVEFTRDIERIITNEACVYQSARQLYAALLAASPSQEKDNG